MNHDLTNIPGRINQKFAYEDDIFSSYATLDIEKDLITVQDPLNLLSEDRQPTYDLGRETYHFCFEFEGVDYECLLIPTTEETLYLVDIENSPDYSKFILYKELQKLPPATGAKNKVKI